MNLNRLLFIQIHTLPPSMMHRKWKEIIGFCVEKTIEKLQWTDSQLKSPMELKDISSDTHHVDTAILE